MNDTLGHNRRYTTIVSHTDRDGRGVLGLTKADGITSLVMPQQSDMSHWSTSPNTTRSDPRASMIATPAAPPAFGHFNGPMPEPNTMLESADAQAWIALLSQLDGMNTSPRQGWPEPVPHDHTQTPEAPLRNPWYSDVQSRSQYNSPHVATPNSAARTPRLRMTSEQQAAFGAARSRAPTMQSTPTFAVTPTGQLPKMGNSTPHLGGTGGDANELLQSLCAQLTPEQRWAHVVSQTSALVNMPVQNTLDEMKLQDDSVIESLLNGDQMQTMEMEKSTLTVPDYAAWPQISPTASMPNLLPSETFEKTNTGQNFSSPLMYPQHTQPIQQSRLAARSDARRISIPQQGNFFVQDGYRGSWADSESSSSTNRADFWTPSIWSNSSGLPTPSMCNGAETNRAWSIHSPTCPPGTMSNAAVSPHQSQQEHLFVNYTPADAATIISGVAPSGSSRKRREERAKKRMTLHMMQSTSSSVRSPTDPNHIRANNLQRSLSKDERQRRLSAPAVSRPARPSCILHRDEPYDLMAVASDPGRLPSPDTGGALVPRYNGRPTTFARQDHTSADGPSKQASPAAFEQTTGGRAMRSGIDPVLCTNEAMYF